MRKVNETSPTWSERCANHGNRCSNLPSCEADDDHFETVGTPDGNDRLVVDTGGQHVT